MKKYLLLTLLISALMGIILPLTLGVKDFTLIAITFSAVWFIYSIILLGYVFLVEGRRNRNKLEMRKEKGPFSLHSTKEWEAIWERSINGHKDPGTGNPKWN